MSEEEITINILKNWENLCLDIEEDYTDLKNSINMILDLYNKEKEKNATILRGNIETFKKLLGEEFEKHYINKDKIKEKIKILEMEIRYDFIDNTKAIKVLKELLESEE